MEKVTTHIIRRLDGKNVRICMYMSDIDGLEESIEGIHRIINSQKASINTLQKDIKYQKSRNWKNAKRKSR